MVLQRMYNRDATRTFCELLVFFCPCLASNHDGSTSSLFSVRGHRMMNNLFSLVKHEDAVRIDQSVFPLPNEPVTSGRGSSPLHQDICYFPWTYDDHKIISWHEVEWTPARLRRWKTVVGRWKGVAVICGESMRPSTVGTVS